MAYNTPDYSGLQLSDRHDGLEVVNKDSAYPEVYDKHSRSYPEVVQPKGYSDNANNSHNAPPLPPKYHEAGGHYPSDHQALPDDLPQEKKRFSRRCWIVSAIVAGVVVVAIIGAVVGVVVSRNSASSSNNTGSSSANSGGSSPGSASPNANSTNGLRSVCRDTVCPQILSAVQAADELMVFARGVDNNIWYNTASAKSIAPWPQTQKWQNLHGGPFLSQPHAVTWNASTRVSVVAVADPDHAARTQTFTIPDSTWNTSWKDLGGRLTSAVTLCAVGGQRLDLWGAVDDKGVVAHNFFDTYKSVYWAPDLSPSWQLSADWKADPTSKGRPAVACRADDFGHDLMIYDGTGKNAKYSSYSDKTSWTPIFTLDSGSSFKGFQSDPVMLASANTRLDFFGIGVDGAMYYGAWNKQDGHSPLVNLGGSFQSVPSAVVTKSGRVDVIALSTRDTLQHRVLQGGKWSLDWEDLGVFGNSAPLAFNLTTNPETVGLFVLGTNGELNQTVWTVSNDLSWKGLKWAGMGGNLTASYFRS